jgi:hypothetical protein
VIEAMVGNAEAKKLTSYPDVLAGRLLRLRMASPR